MDTSKLFNKVDSIADNLGMPIDEGIKKMVVALWAHEFETTGSCEGHTNRGCPFPWIDIETDFPDGWEYDAKVRAKWRKDNKEQAKPLKKLLDEFNKNSDFPFPLALVPRGTLGALRLQTGRTKNIDDELPPDYLDETQEQMSTFADFLLAKIQKTKP